MKIKKIVAETIQEGKQKVLKELGEEAVILSTRAFKSIEHGGKMMQEIVAAINGLRKMNNMAPIERK